MGRSAATARGWAKSGPILLVFAVIATLVSVASPAAAAGRTPGSFTPVTPARLLDTRDGVGGVHSAVAARRAIRFKVTGTAGVPDSGVAAVALNVTVTEPTSGGFLTVYPDGGTPPNVSNLNFVAGQTVPNSVLVPVSSAGYIDFFNGSFQGSVQVIADISGYYLSGQGGSAGSFGSVYPTRILDSRTGIGGVHAPIPARRSAKVHVTGVAGVPTANVAAVVLNVTVTQPAAGGYVTAYAASSNAPSVSNLNFVAGQTVPNLVVVPVSSAGDVDLFNGSWGGSTHLVADIAGYYLGGMPAVGGAFGTSALSRLLDTRYGTGGKTGPVASRGVVRLKVTGVANVPTGNVAAVVLNVTVTQPQAGGFVSAYPDGMAPPNVSNLNFSPGTTVPNLVVVPVSANGYVDLYNASGGSTQLIADVYGYYLDSDAPVQTPGPVAPVPTPTTASALSVTGMDLHDGMVRKVGDTYYLYGTMYGCGFQWGQPSRFCGFGVSTAPALTGPWSTPTLLFAPTDTDPFTGTTWNSVCADTGAGCFNPRMLQRTWSSAGAADGAFLLWFNAPADWSQRHTSAYYVMRCSGPTGPCGSAHKPDLSICTGNGDFTVVTPDGANPVLLCTMADQTLAEEQLTASGMDGAHVGGTVLAGLHNVEAPGAYYDAPSGKWIMTFSDPNCGYCAGDGTGYALASRLLGPWTAPGNSGAGAPGTGRRDISATSCGGQPRTVFTVDGQPWQWIDTWTAWNGVWLNQTRAGIVMVTLKYTPSDAPTGGVLPPQFAQWPCA